MPKRQPTDLFGVPVRQRRPRYEAALERADRAALAERAERVRWLAKVIPNAAFGMPVETFLVFKEAKNSYVYGNFVAATLLATAFIEHWLASLLVSCGYEKEATKGLAACTRVARRENLIDGVLADKVDELRQIRNPLAHLRACDDAHGVGNRLHQRSFDLQRLLLEDAQEALRTMYGIAVYSRLALRPSK